MSKDFKPSSPSFRKCVCVGGEVLGSAMCECVTTMAF